MSLKRLHYWETGSHPGRLEPLSCWIWDSLGRYDAQDRRGEETIFKVTFNLESIKDNWIWLSLSEND